MSQSTPVRYHPAHVIIHWLMALLVAMILFAGKFAMPAISADDPQKVMMLQSHAYLGGFAALLLVIRVVMRFAIKVPAEANEDNAALRFIAKATHVSLYILILGMAVSGLGIYQALNLPEVFSGATSYPKNFFDYPQRMGHGLISTLLLLLTLLHIGAALYHQFIKKDNLIARMWFGKN